MDKWTNLLLLRSLQLLGHSSFYRFKNKTKIKKLCLKNKKSHTLSDAINHIHSFKGWGEREKKTESHAWMTFLLQNLWTESWGLLRETQTPFTTTWPQLKAKISISILQTTSRDPFQNLTMSLWGWRHYPHFEDRKLLMRIQRLAQYMTVHDKKEFKAASVSLRSFCCSQGISLKS